jgi:hypothetical protein
VYRRSRTAQIVIAKTVGTNHATGKNQLNPPNFPFLPISRANNSSAAVVAGCSESPPYIGYLGYKVDEF